ncbi:hypothetical protein ACFQFH_06670 [Halobaculum halobium]|uniref:hypothetical protein n=1 Tax=Halobaculum halobium TaxID=3032281 RepID=UPI0036123248
MDTGRFLGNLRGTARPAGVGLAATLGGGLLYLPGGVAQGAGPQAPVSYLLAGGGIACLAVAFAVVASGPFAERGPVYGSVSRVWGSRRLGALAAWSALAGYVALLALLAEWIGRLAPLPASTGAYVSGTLGAPTGLAALSGFGVPAPLVGDALALAACLLALGVHLAGTRRAAVAAAVPGWGSSSAWERSSPRRFSPASASSSPRTSTRYTRHPGSDGRPCGASSAASALRCSRSSGSRPPPTPPRLIGPTTPTALDRPGSPRSPPRASPARS